MDELAGRREDDRRVEWNGRRRGRVADPRGAELGGERLVPPAITCTDVDVRAAPARDLDRDVSGRSETVEAEPGAGERVEAREGERPESDDAGAEERRRVAIREAGRNRIREIRGRDDEFGETAVDGPACEVGGVA